MLKGKDLTKEAPRSPKIKLGGYAILARTIDKCLASMNGIIGDYHYDCPLDKQLFGFKGVEGAEFKEAVKSAKTESEIIAWFNAHGAKKSPAETEIWSVSVMAGSLYSIPEKREYFSAECKKLGLNPEKTTTFEWLDADDKVSFSKT